MDAADDLLQNKLVPHKITPRKTTYLACSSISRDRGRDFRERDLGPASYMQMASPTRPPPPPPVTVAYQRQQQRRDENLRGYEGSCDEEERSSDPASKIWTKIRRCSGRNESPRHRNLSTSTTASVAASVSLPFPANCVATDSRALRRRKAGLDPGGSLLRQKQRLAATGSTASLTDRTNLGLVKNVPMAGQRRTSRENVKGRRGSGRWGVFGGWLA